MLYELKKDDLVVAAKDITEGGEDCPGRASAKFPDKNYIHTKKGDMGRIVHINEAGYPTVQFEDSGTATIVDWPEIERKVPFFNAPPLLDKYFDLIGL